jgi:hypothetical protein
MLERDDFHGFGDRKNFRSFLTIGIGWRFDGHTHSGGRTDSYRPA